MEIDVWRIRVEDLLMHWDPFCAWEVPAVAKSDIAEAIAQGRFDRRCFHDLTNLSIAEEWRFHVDRISWLVQNHDTNPIEIDVGVPGLGHQPLHGAFDMVDGNHRLAAASYRGDGAIDVIYNGAESQMALLFPDGRNLGPSGEQGYITAGD